MCWPRVFVDDLDEALPAYQRPSGPAAPREARVSGRPARLGRLIQLIQALVDQRTEYERTAKPVVDDIDTARTVVETDGGEVLGGPADAPTAHE